MTRNPRALVARRLLLMLLSASWGCADFPQALLDFCQDNTRCVESPPQPVSGVKQASAGGHFTLVVRNDGSVWAFGQNTSGQLGDGTTGSRAAAKPITSLGSVSSVSAGFDHALALVGGHVYTWGRLASGELQTTPVVVSGQTGIKEIAAGTSYSLILDQSGTVSIWGSNSSLQTDSSPQEIKELSGIQHIAAGGAHALAVDGAGNVWAWGDNSYSQLGNTSTGGIKPVKVEGLSNISLVAAGLRHSLALDKDGKVWAWGGNSAGQLGDGTKNGPQVKPQVVEGLSTIKISLVAAGASHSLAMTQDNDIMSWGSDSAGQLGDDISLKDQLTPVEVSEIRNAQSISAGFSHSLAVDANATLFVWGSNGDGQAGPSPGNAIPIPIPITFSDTP